MSHLHILSIFVIRTLTGSTSEHIEYVYEYIHSNLKHGIIFWDNSPPVKTDFHVAEESNQRNGQNKKMLNLANLYLKHLKYLKHLRYLKHLKLYLSPVCTF